MLMFVKLLYHRRYGFVHGVSYNFFKEVVVFIRISKKHPCLDYYKYIISLVPF